MTRDQDAKLTSIYNIVSQAGGEFSNLYTKEVLSQEDLIYILDNAMFYKVFIGSEVELNNSVCGVKRWVIGDINHDGTSNTIDLIAQHSVKDSTAFGSNQQWTNSAIRTWLNGTFINGFDTEILNRLQTMQVSTNNAITEDKAKLLSGTEIGLVHEYNITGEGTRYPSYGFHIKKNLDEDANTVWWLRSRRTGNGSAYVWGVGTSGYVSTDYAYTNTCSVVPAIRLS